MYVLLAGGTVGVTLPPPRPLPDTHKHPSPDLKRQVTLAQNFLQGYICKHCVELWRSLKGIGKAYRRCLNSFLDSLSISVQKHRHKDFLLYKSLSVYVTREKNLKNARGTSSLSGGGGEKLVFLPITYLVLITLAFNFSFSVRH